MLNSFEHDVKTIDTKANAITDNCFIVWFVCPKVNDFWAIISKSA